MLPLLNLEVLLQCQRHCPRVVVSVPVLCCHSFHLLPRPHDATCAPASLHVAIFSHERTMALNDDLHGCTPQARYAAAGPLLPAPGRYETVIPRDNEPYSMAWPAHIHPRRVSLIDDRHAHVRQFCERRVVLLSSENVPVQGCVSATAGVLWV